METSPFNKKLHQLLMSQGYIYSYNTRYDRYDKNGRTIFYYLNNYIMIIEENGEPAPAYVKREIEELL